MVIFLDIEGTFNNINPSAIVTALSNLGVNENIVGLVGNLLTKRPVLATLGTTSLMRFVNRGTPQGVVILTSLERSDE